MLASNSSRSEQTPAKAWSWLLDRMVLRSDRAGSRSCGDETLPRVDVGLSLPDDLRLGACSSFVAFGDSGCEATMTG